MFAQHPCRRALSAAVYPGLFALLALMGLLPRASAADSVTATRTMFGTMPNGQPVYEVTLRNGRGITVRIINYGARVQSILTPDRDGHRTDIALGYASLKGYLSKGDPFFGATVGRFSLDGHAYQLTINDGPNSLHGGVRGFDKVLWKITSVKQVPAAASVTMRHVSANGDQGYPGTLTAWATYSLHADGRLSIRYRATTDAPTIVNITNHIYWNLSGEGSGSVLGEWLMIAGSEITPVDATQIPTGRFASVAGTPFDFLKPKPIGRDIREGRSRQLVIGRGYDMNWVISRAQTTRQRRVARVWDPKSGRVIELYSDQPGLQFYSGNFLNGTVVGTSGHIYRQGDAFVLEPQRFPDTPNHANFGSAVLLPGQTYRNDMTYRFSVRPAVRRKAH